MTTKKTVAKRTSTGKTTRMKLTKQEAALVTQLRLQEMVKVTTVANNRKFKKLSASGKRVAIAKDVLEQLNAKRYLAKERVYVAKAA